MRMVLAILAAVSAMTGLGASSATPMGRTGEMFRSALGNRVHSAYAQGPVYDECVRSFATHWDDSTDEKGKRRAGWQGEYWGKTMLCHAGAVRVTGDRALADWCVARAREFIDAYQQANGYLSTYREADFVRANPNSDDPAKHWCFNIWGQKYTLWALVELSRVTGDRVCLKAAEKLADHLVAQMDRLHLTLDRTGSWAGISSLSMLRPLLELYRDIPKPAYRAMIEGMVRATDVSSEPKPIMNVIHDSLGDRPIHRWFGNPALLAKAYELMSYFEGVADYSRLTDDRRALDATKAFWNHLVGEELNPMRSVGYFDHFLNSRQRVNGMTELCDVIHWIRLNRELWLLTGDTRHLDCMEEAFYNAFLAGVSEDGAWAAHIVRSHGTRHFSAPPQTGMKLHQCCPDNMLRTFYDWSDTIAGIAADKAVEVNFYSDADVRLPGARVEIHGDYPVSESFRIRVTADEAGRLRLRVPRWTDNAVVDGMSLAAVDGRVEIALPKGERTFAVSFDMKPRLVAVQGPAVEDVQAMDTSMHRADFTKVFMKAGAPELPDVVRTNRAVTVMRGPLVLAKGRRVGTSREETLAFESIGSTVKGLIALPMEKGGVWGAWKLSLDVGGVRKEVPVGDFWSVSRGNDPTNWFSLWF